MFPRGALLAAMSAAMVLSSLPTRAAVLVTVDKTLQQMTVSVDGVRRYTWPVSTGRAGYATPSGSFKPFRMEAQHYSKEWDDAPMPNSIFFTAKGHAIHGSFETRRLGTAASHGCVRISPANAKTLFALVKTEGMSNTKVVLTGQAPPMIARRQAPPSGEPLQLQPPDGQAQSGQLQYQAQYQPQPYGQPPGYVQPLQRSPFPFFNRY